MHCGAALRDCNVVFVVFRLIVRMLVARHEPEFDVVMVIRFVGFLTRMQRIVILNTRVAHEHFILIVIAAVRATAIDLPCIPAQLRIKRKLHQPAAAIIVPNLVDLAAIAGLFNKGHRVRLIPSPLGIDGVYHVVILRHVEIIGLAAKFRIPVVHGGWRALVRIYQLHASVYPVGDWAALLLFFFRLAVIPSGSSGCQAADTAIHHVSGLDAVFHIRDAVVTGIQVFVVVEYHFIVRCVLRTLVINAIGKFVCRAGVCFRPHAKAAYHGADSIAVSAVKQLIGDAHLQLARLGAEPLFDTL